MFQVPAADGVASLVVSNHFFLFGRDDLVLLFQATDHAVNGIVEIFHFHLVLAFAGSDQGCLVTYVGNVGAGKTAVAAATLLIAALNGFQGAIMAPTELLAEQHARSIGAMLEPFGIKTVLLTGSLKTRERNLGKAALVPGDDKAMDLIVNKPLPAGHYVVTWHALSKDGHKTEGKWSFTVK